MPRGYQTVSLPIEVLETLDHFIEENRDGFSSRPEVIKAALRTFYDQHRWVPRHRREVPLEVRP